VTIPHKQAVLPLVDELTPTAAAVGAVNTLYLRGERLLGDNTDVPGFLGDLHAQLGAYLPELGGCALVLGAGGSARAVVYALASAGWQVIISTRRMEQAEELIARMPTAYRSTRLETCPLLPAELAERLPIDLIVNTTPLGMTPEVEGCPWPEGLPFPVSAAVYDLVYNPRETSLVRAARAAGLPAVTGLGMLVEQAALAFKLWTGRDVERSVMFGAVSS
jgi:shikimate dehydrogenase